MFMEYIKDLICVLFQSFGAYYVIRLIRILPFIKTMNERGIKPIACNVCISFWVNLFITLAYLYIIEECINWYLFIPAAGLTLILLEKLAYNNNYKELDI